MRSALHQACCILFLTHRVSQVFCCLIPLSLCFSLSLNTWMIMAYGVSVLLQPHLGERIKRLRNKPWIFLFWGLYGWHLLGMIWTEELAVGQFILEKKASLLVLPLLLGLDASWRERTLSDFLLVLAVGCTVLFWGCLAAATRRYMITQNPGEFFYHQLGSPIPNFSAIYQSWYALVALAGIHYLQNKPLPWVIAPSALRWGLAASLALSIVLWSSKLFIVLTIIYLVMVLARRLRGRSAWVWAAALAILIFGVAASEIPRTRFQQILDSEFAILEQDQYRWDTPFNGLTLRLVFWKFGWEILNEEQAFFSGVGPGDAQNLMNATLREHQMYLGNPELGDRGYWDHNFHNQYVELAVQTGFVGVLLYLSLLYRGARRAFPLGLTHPLAFFVATVMAFSLFESLLERQHGVVFFAFFLSLIPILSTYGRTEIRIESATRTADRKQRAPVRKSG